MATPEMAAPFRRQIHAFIPSGSFARPVVRMIFVFKAVDSVKMATLAMVAAPWPQKFK
jgi:hypothetical protein